MRDELDILGIDPTAVGLPAAAAVAAGLGLKWVAGPSIQAVGQAFGEWTQIRVRNLLRLGERVEKRIQPGDDSDGSVPPRLLYKILEDGSWIDDDLAQEYLAGILVGSRSADGGNEDGVYMAHVLSTLTSTQVRMHYAVYQKFATLTPDLEVGDVTVTERNALWAPLYDVARAINRRESEEAVTFAASGLIQANLLRVPAIGPPSIFEPPGYFTGVPQRSAFVATATLLGSELYQMAVSELPPGSLPTETLLDEAWISDRGTVPIGL